MGHGRLGLGYGHRIHNRFCGHGSRIAEKKQSGQSSERTFLFQVAGSDDIQWLIGRLVGVVSRHYGIPLQLGDDEELGRSGSSCIYGHQLYAELGGIVPILSFNYGAGHLNRVKETLFLGFKTNEIVVHKDEVDSNVYIITKGIWRAYHFKNGEEATAWFATPGELVFSVWGYISDEPSRLSFESMTESEAICLSKEELHRHFNSSITMANLGRRMLENFILLYENWLMDLWKKNAFERYLTLLDEYPEVIQQIPMKYIASYLGVTVQSLSRIRASLNEMK